MPHTYMQCGQSDTMTIQTHTKMFLNGTVPIGFCLVQSSDYGATTVAKVTYVLST